MENKIKKAIEYLNSIFGEGNYEICGSTALFLRNKLDRIPNDIDIITKENTYNSYHYAKKIYTKDNTIRRTNSHNFNHKDVEVSSYCILNNILDIKIDVFYRRDVPMTGTFFNKYNVFVSTIEEVKYYNFR